MNTNTTVIDIPASLATLLPSSQTVIGVGAWLASAVVVIIAIGIGWLALSLVLSGFKAIAQRLGH